MGLFGIKDRDTSETGRYPKSKTSRHAHEPLSKKKLRLVYGARPGDALPQSQQQVDFNHIVIHSRQPVKKLNLFLRMYNYIKIFMRMILKKFR